MALICHSAGELLALKPARPLVLSNGVFDLLHAGHVRYLQTAKTLGATLVVALNTDASVRRLGKGPQRPWQNVDDRCTVMAALACVDYVLTFDEDNASTVVAALQPEIYVKGADYTSKALPEAAIVQSYGGSVTLLPLTPACSSTRLIQALQTATQSCI